MQLWFLRDLRTLIPLRIFSCETKLVQVKFLKLKFSPNYINAFVVDCVGRRRGLALLWNQNVDLTFRSFTKYHINVIIKFSNLANAWRFTGIYGDPKVSKRKRA